MATHEIEYVRGIPESLRYDAARRLYERNGFSATRTERFTYLRWFLGFGASTTMVRPVSHSKP